MKKKGGIVSFDTPNYYCQKKKKIPSMNADILERNFTTLTKRPKIWKMTGKENTNCQLDYPL